MTYKYLFILFFAFTWCSYSQTQAALMQSKSLAKTQDQKKLLEEWFKAAKDGNLKQMRQLSVNVDINAQDDGRYTALIFQAYDGNLDIVKFLLEFPDINVNARTQYGWSPLMYAALQGHENIVQLLLAVPGINITFENESGSALTLATRMGHEKIVELLLQASAGFSESSAKININALDRLGKGLTALMHAAEMGHENIVKILLQVPGININVQNKNGQTALNFAIEKKKDAVAKLIQDKIDELTAQAFQSITDTNIESLKSAITQIGVNIKDKAGDSLLHKAVKQKKLEIIRFLLLTDLSCLDINGAGGKDAIELAVGNLEIFEFFISLIDFERYCAHPDCAKPSCTKKCSRCSAAFYCSVDCQKKHWPTHKHNCKSKES